MIVHTDVSFSEDEHLGGFPRNYEMIGEIVKISNYMCIK